MGRRQKRGAGTSEDCLADLMEREAIAKVAAFECRVLVER